MLETNVGKRLIIHYIISIIFFKYIVELDNLLLPHTKFSSAVMFQILTFRRNDLSSQGA